ncbi:DUF2637 domain-containing protein [Sphaerisporangium sp. NPDC088356]|uniref:DUF2637 domain-containing protein n=1 Tax=Sphaerisporangium sp. NPDC088356 TaxID=3154871 RepID=UPI003444E584
MLNHIHDADHRPIGTDDTSPIGVEASTETPRPLTQGEFTTSAVIGAVTLVLGLIGFVNSFEKVATAAVPSFGWFAWTVPLGIDLGIAVFSVLDIVLCRLGMRVRFLRMIPWALTAATIYLNIAGETDAFAIVAHAILPLLWVIAVEVGAHVLRKRAGLSSATRMDSIRKSRWILALPSTFSLWRRMILWEIRSYPLALQRERDRVLAKTELQDRYGRLWRWKATRRERALYKLGELAPVGTETSVSLPVEETVPEGETIVVPEISAVTEQPSPPSSPTPKTSRPRTRQGTKKGTVPEKKRPLPNVEDLLPAGREVAKALADEGRPLTRDNLLTAIREKVQPVSTARATQLLRVLKDEISADQLDGQTDLADMAGAA